MQLLLICTLITLSLSYPNVYVDDTDDLLAEEDRMKRGEDLDLVERGTEELELKERGTEELELEERGTEEVDPEPAKCDADRCVQDQGKAMYLNTGETIEVLCGGEVACPGFGVCSYGFWFDL